MDDFKDRLFRHMKKKKFNRSSLARHINVAPSTVNAWVAGTSKPELKNLDTTAEALEVTAEYLLYGADNSQNVNFISEPLETYGISKDELIEFFKWKSEKAVNEADEARKKMERLKSNTVDANR